MSKVWEIDFYSRPILDERQKKIWELLICNPQRTFEYTKYCSGAEANARWLEAALAEAMTEWRQSLGLGAEAQPDKIRFFRRQMSNIISRGCEALGVPSQASRRTFGIYQWLVERSQTVYPEHPGYQPLMAPPAEFEPAEALLLPDALVGQGWAVVTLPVQAFAEMDEWEIAFSDVFPLDLLKLDPEAMVPGVVIFSDRAVPLAGWMSGLELACLSLDAERTPRLLLETGLIERWVIATLEDPELRAEIEALERTKQGVEQVHFLAVQSSPDAQEFAGFWLLRDMLPI